MAIVVVTLVGVKNSSAVCQMKELLPVGFPSEGTQLAESLLGRGALANFITQGVRAVPVTNDSLS